MKPRENSADSSFVSESTVMPFPAWVRLPGETQENRYTYRNSIREIKVGPFKIIPVQRKAFVPSSGGGVLAKLTSVFSSKASAATGNVFHPKKKALMQPSPQSSPEECVCIETPSGLKIPHLILSILDIQESDLEQLSDKIWLVKKKIDDGILQEFNLMNAVHRSNSQIPYTISSELRAYKIKNRLSDKDIQEQIEGTIGVHSLWRTTCEVVGRTKPLELPLEITTNDDVGAEAWVSHSTLYNDEILLGAKDRNDLIAYMGAERSKKIFELGLRFEDFSKIGVIPMDRSTVLHEMGHLATMGAPKTFSEALAVLISNLSIPRTEMQTAPICACAGNIQIFGPGQEGWNVGEKGTSVNKYDGFHSALGYGLSCELWAALDRNIDNLRALVRCCENGGEYKRPSTHEWMGKVNNVLPGFEKKISKAIAPQKPGQKTYWFKKDMNPWGILCSYEMKDPREGAKSLPIVAQIQFHDGTAYNLEAKGGELQIDPYFLTMSIWSKGKLDSAIIEKLAKPFQIIVQSPGEGKEWKHLPGRFQYNQFYYEAAKRVQGISRAGLPQ